MCRHVSVRADQSSTRSQVRSFSFIDSSPSCRAASPAVGGFLHRNVRNHGPRSELDSRFENSYGSSSSDQALEAKPRRQHPTRLASPDLNPRWWPWSPNVFGA